MGYASWLFSLSLMLKHFILVVCLHHIHCFVQVHDSSFKTSTDICASQGTLGVNKVRKKQFFTCLLCSNSSCLLCPCRVAVHHVKVKPRCTVLTMLKRLDKIRFRGPRIRDDFPDLAESPPASDNECNDDMQLKPKAALRDTEDLLRDPVSAHHAFKSLCMEGSRKWLLFPSLSLPLYQTLFPYFLKFSGITLTTIQLSCTNFIYTE